MSEKKIVEEVEGEEVKKKKIRASFKQLRVIASQTFGDVTLREFDSICCDGAVLIEGFNKGLTSVMATNYIVDQLKLPLVGDIISDKFSTYALVENGFPVHGARIYGNKRIVVFVSDYDFSIPGIQNNLVRAVYDFARRHRNRMIITIDGVPGDPSRTAKRKLTIDDLGVDKKKEKKPTKKKLLKQLDEEYEQKIWFLTNNDQLGEKMIKMGHLPVKRMAITGISGGLIAEAPLVSIPVCAIFGNLHPHFKLGNRTAVSLISCIGKLLGENVDYIDVTNLKEENESIENMLKEFVKKAKLGGHEEPPSGWYI